MDLQQVANKLRDVVATSEQAYADGAPEKIEAFTVAASTYRQIGQPEKAVPLYERVLAMLDAAPSPGVATLATTLAQLGQSYAVVGEKRKALRTCIRCRNLLEQLSPPPMDAIFSIRGNIAGLYLSLGDYERAAKGYRRLIKIGQSGEVKAESLAAFHENLGIVYFKQGELKRADKALRRALRLRKASLGYKDPSVAVTLQNLARVCEKLGDRERQERYQDRVNRVLRYHSRSSL